MISEDQASAKPQVSQMFSDMPAGTPKTTNSPSSLTNSSQIKHTFSPSQRESMRFNKNGSMTPSAALARYGRVLSPYEHKEIIQYPEIWFVGPSARKLNAGSGKGKNYGYDDDKGRYKCVKNDHIAYRFEVQKGLGKGSFGDVVRAYDHKDKCMVALKIIRNEKRFHKQGKCEVKILDHLRMHDQNHEHNVIHMKDYFIFREHLCITFEMMHCDLYSALKRDSFKGFSLDRVQSVAASIFQSLSLLKKLRIIHCDLKPENILLESAESDQVKVIDFGSSCFDDQRVHTYIQSRFYRSPEVILGLSYGCSIDMWSLGCILTELCTGQPIFPGHNEKEQLMYQMQVLGIPPAALIKKGKRAGSFFDSDNVPKHIIDRKGRTRPPGSRPLTTAIGSSDPAFLDFIKQCLTWNVDDRITPDRAMQHPFVRAAVEQNKAAAYSPSSTLSNGQVSEESVGRENEPPTIEKKSKEAVTESAKKRSHLNLIRSLTSRKSKS